MNCLLKYKSLSKKIENTKINKLNIKCSIKVIKIVLDAEKIEIFSIFKIKLPYFCSLYKLKFINTKIQNRLFLI